ncbi:MAG: AMP-binding protein [Synergistaceae bacterium]|nr:AMP-binding protein [Synergistaceae bacterium]
MPLINLGLNRYYHFNKLAFKIYKKFNVEIHSAKLTGGASIEDIENIILDALLNNSNASEVVNTEVQGGITEADLTFPQLVVCYDCMKRPTEVLYNVPSILKLPDNLNINKLLEILRSIVEAHPALSTSFKLKDGKVVQVYNNARDNVNFEALTLNISEQELESYKKEFVKPFDLSKGPLYRFAAVKTDNNLYLLTDFHHLVLDGASLNLFIEELAAALDGLMPEPESYDYFNYAADEKVFEQSEKFAENQKFFAAMMKNFESAAEITADLNGREENGLMKRVVSEFDFNKAEEFCRQRGITPAALYLAATAYAVSRFVNDKNIFMSTISNGRSDLRTARTYGMFVNTLPLGIDIKDETVGEFLKRSAALLSDTIEHEKYPFAKIASDYGFEPKIMYEYQIGVVSSGSALECHTFGLELTKFKLAVHIEDEGVAIYYNDALYSEELIKNLARSIVIASEAMIININKSVKSIELIDADRREVLGHFRTEAKADIKTKLYHKIIHENAIKSPDKIALIACDGKFTYKELDEITNGMAKALIEKGVKPRDRAALLLPRTSRVIMSMFGVMKAGAAYIPCDPEYPAERVNHVINDSGSQFVITTADRLKDFKNAIDVETLINKSSEAPETDVAPQDLAYLIYTSGSTGKPKGVMLRHESICNYLTNHEANRHIHALASDANILLIVTTVSFDMSLKELGAALFNGLTLVFADEEHTTNPMKLAELFKQTGADAFNATPSRYVQYMEYEPFLNALKKCKLIMAGGEPFPKSLLERLQG